MTNHDGRTHYDVVGVEPGATKDEVRDAYRARLEELLEEAAAPKAREDAKEAVRGETARLKAAWQVLSDPFQRQRYDGSLAGPAAGGDGGDTDLEGDEGGAGAPAGRRRTFGARAATAAPEEPPPTWPPGFRPPPPRARLIAMAIDLVVLGVLVFGVQALGEAVIDSAYPEETDRIERKTDDLDDAEARRDRAEDRADAAEDRAQQAREEGDEAAREAARTDERRERAIADAEDERIDGLEDDLRDLQGDLVPARLVVAGVTFVLAMAYLVPMSALTGRTLGKRLLVVRAVRTDGSPLGWRGAFARYAPPLLIALFLAPVLGQIAFALVLVAVVTWVWNRNRQGLHDRLAGTIVVDG